MFILFPALYQPIVFDLIRDILVEIHPRRHRASSEIHTDLPEPSLCFHSSTFSDLLVTLQMKVSRIWLILFVDATVHSNLIHLATKACEQE